MVIAEGHLAIIIRTPRASSTTALLIDRLRPAQNTGLFVKQNNVMVKILSSEVRQILFKWQVYCLLAV